MSIWLCRAGRYGQYEARFLEDSKIFYTFEEIALSLSSFGSRKDLQEYFVKISPGIKENAASVYATQGWTFFDNMKPGDWVITPSKTSPGLLYFAEIVGDYIYDENSEESYRHSRPVKWFAEMYRNQFEQDIQSALGALMTICKIKQEDRIRKSVATHISLADNKSLTPPNNRSGFGTGIARRYFQLSYSELQRAWACSNC